MTSFQLRFPISELPFWAERYSYPGEPEIVERVGPAARARGHLDRDEFIRLTTWKTPRSKSRCASNSTELIEEVTRIALSSRLEELKIRVLSVLNGVSWPTASVILHFCDKGSYPILDFRALWSLGVPVPSQYTFTFWWEFVRATRQIQEQSGLDMRTVDRALWQYSKENQRTDV